MSTTEKTLMSNSTAEKPFTFYLAGPDVFYANAKEHGAQLVAEVQKHGFNVLFPLDAELELPEEMSRKEKAAKIYLSNVRLIEQCDAVLANVNDFRGDDPDAGTAFEIGYAAALGKSIFLYMDNAKPLRGKIAPQGFDYCSRGWLIEDFDLPVNLMLACASDEIYQGTLSTAIAKIAEQIKEGLHSL